MSIIYKQKISAKSIEKKRASVEITYPEGKIFSAQVYIIKQA